MNGYKSFNSSTTAIIFYLILICSPACRKSDYLVKEEVLIQDHGGGTGTVTWENDKSYLLEGFVFVNDGQVLSIEPGTVIRARTGQGTAASALIVARGGKIIAEGTPDQPIIFTVEGDDLKGSVPADASGLWGGLIILGDAPINAPVGESHIEGIPLIEARGLYGGYDPEHNAGILRYVSIRHGGTNIGEGNEINGLTLGGVGRGTTIDHIEVISNADDGVEFFGGNVNCSHIVVSFCGDDAFDFDEGYHGHCQFLVAILDDEKGDHAAEHSGGQYLAQTTPYTVPVIANATYIGHYLQKDSALISYNSNGGGLYYNSVFTDQPTGIELEYNENESNCYDQFLRGNLGFYNNVFSRVALEDTSSWIRAYTDDSGNPDSINQELLDHLIKENNKRISIEIGRKSGSVQLLPGSYQFRDFTELPGAFLKETNYKGAFGTFDWLSGWTLTAESGAYLKP